MLAAQVATIQDNSFLNLSKFGCFSEGGKMRLDCVTRM